MKRKYICKANVYFIKDDPFRGPKTSFSLFLDFQIQLHVSMYCFNPAHFVYRTMFIRTTRLNNGQNI